MTNPLYYCLRRGQAAAAAGGAPVATITHSDAATFSTTRLRGASGQSLFFDPGNGDAPDEIVMAGAGVDSNWSKAYLTGEEKTVQISGALSDLETFWLYEPTISRVDLTLLTGVLNLSLSLGQVDTMDRLPPNVAVLRFIGNQMTSLDSFSGLPLDDMSLVRIDGNPIIYTTQTFPAVNGGEFDFSDTVTTTGEVDNWIMDLSVGNAEWQNTTTNLAGTNPARSSASDAEVAWFVTIGGNALTINE